MKTGYQNSRFAHQVSLTSVKTMPRLQTIVGIHLVTLVQVERFACLYTGQVSNLSLYSPDKYYRPSEDFMPHEFDILSL